MRSRAEDAPSSLTLVLLPGLDGTGLLFRDFIAALGAGVRTIVVAYPPDGKEGYGELESIVRGLLPQNEPYWLLAESFSGPIGISIAACAPTNLRGLILCCSFARNPLPWLAFARHLIGLAPVKLLPTVLLSRLILGRFTTTRRRAALAMALRSVSQAALQARARAVLAVNVSKELARIDLPVIYLRATEDRIVPAACGDHAAVVLPRLRIETFVGPHFLLQVSPVEVAARLLEGIKLDPSRFG